MVSETSMTFSKANCLHNQQVATVFTHGCAEVRSLQQTLHKL